MLTQIKELMKARKDKKRHAHIKATDRLVEDIVDYRLAVAAGSNFSDKKASWLCKRYDVYASIQEWLKTSRKHYGWFSYMANVEVEIATIAKRVRKRTNLDIEECEILALIYESAGGDSF